MKKLIFLTALISISFSNLFSQIIWNGSNTTENAYRTGNVGIGTDSPSGNLEVANSEGGKLIISTNRVNGSVASPLKPSIDFLGYQNGNKARISAHEVTYNTHGSALSFYVNDGNDANSLKERLTIIRNGNIGIGTTNPSSSLHVKGEMFLEGTTDNGNGWNTNYLFYRGHSLIIGTKPGGYAHNVLELKPGGSSTGALRSQLRMYTASDVDNQELKVDINSNGNSFFNGGNVGIGTTNPSATLTVKGNILASKIEVKNDSEIPASDYVFYEDYNLRSLSEVEQFVKENKHLPEVPSAAEFKKNGYSVGEMDDILLRKVEELTLYMIDMKKKLDEKDAQIEELQQKISQIEKAE
jgi:hypothetical protein